MGRTVSLACAGPPDLRRIASILTHQNKFPFQTEADVLRWCIQHGLDILVKRAENKEVSQTLKVFETWRATATTELELMFYTKKLDALEKTILVLIDSGHPVKAEMLAEKIHSQSHLIDDEYWKEKFHTRSGSLLSRARRKVKLQVEAKRRQDEEDGE